jgi:hypothetical protein
MPAGSLLFCSQRLCSLVVRPCQAFRLASTSVTCRLPPVSTDLRSKDTCSGCCPHTCCPHARCPSACRSCAVHSCAACCYSLRGVGPGHARPAQPFTLQDACVPGRPLQCLVWKEWARVRMACGIPAPSGVHTSSAVSIIGTDPFGGGWSYV